MSFWGCACCKAFWCASGSSAAAQVGAPTLVTSKGQIRVECATPQRPDLDAIESWAFDVNPVSGIVARIAPMSNSTPGIYGYDIKTGEQKWVIASETNFWFPDSGYSTASWLPRDVRGAPDGTFWVLEQITYVNSSTQTVINRFELVNLDAAGAVKSHVSCSPYAPVSQTVPGPAGTVSYTFGYGAPRMAIDSGGNVYVATPSYWNLYPLGPPPATGGFPVQEYLLMTVPQLFRGASQIADLTTGTISTAAGPFCMETDQNGNTYVGGSGLTGGSSIVAFSSAGGAPIWTSSALSPLPGNGCICLSPAASAANLIVGSAFATGSPNLVALDAATGRLVWSKTYPSSVPACLADTVDSEPNVYVNTGAAFHKGNSGTDSTLGTFSVLSPGAPYWMESPMIWPSGRIGPFGVP